MLHPLLVTIRRQHPVDGKTGPDTAQHVHIIEFQQPIRIIHHQRLAIGKVNETAHLLLEAIAIVLDHFSSHHFAHVGLPGRISDHRRTAADEANGTVPCALHMSHDHHAQKMTDMQTVRRRIETDIKRNFFFRQ